MNKNRAGFKTRKVICVSVLALCALGLNACGQGSQQQMAAPTANATPKPPLPANAKLALNHEPKGTTNDTSELSQTLTRIFKEREEYRITKEGTLDIEKTLYLKADPAIKISDIFKVIDVAKEAGASPILLPIEVSGDKAKDIKPDRLLLLVTIGNSELSVEGVSGGVELTYVRPVKPAVKDDFSDMTGVITIRRDGEYFIGGKPIGKSALANELKSQFAHLPPGARTLTVLFESETETSYSSLAEIAYAASEAYIKELRMLVVNS